MNIFDPFGILYIVFGILAHTSSADFTIRRVSDVQTEYVLPNCPGSLLRESMYKYFSYIYSSISKKMAQLTYGYSNIINEDVDTNSTIPNYYQLPEYFDQYIRSNLIAYWNFYKSYVYFNNTGVTDLSNSRYDLLLTDLKSISQESIEFDQNTSAIRNSVTLDFRSTGVTYEIFINLNTIVYYRPLIFFTDNTASSSGVWILQINPITVNSVTSNVFTIWNGNGNFSETSFDIVPGNWYHVVWTCDNLSNLKVYINNINHKVWNVNNRLHPILPSQRTIQLGLGKASSSLLACPCKIWMARIYNKELSLNEISINYNSILYSLKQNTTFTYVTNGLYAFYDFSRGSYSGSGLNLNDLSGQNYTLTFNNVGTYQSSTLPYYMEWTVSRYCLGTVPSTTFTDGFTFEILIYPTSLSNNPTIIGFKNASNQHVNLFINSNGSIGLVNTTITSSGRVSINSWNHIVIVWRNSASHDVYVNSISIPVIATTGISTAFTELYIDNYSNLGNFGAAGYFSMARVYNRNLNLFEVIQNYNDIKNNDKLLTLI